MGRPRKVRPDETESIPSGPATGAANEEELREQARAADEAAKAMGVKAPRGDSASTQRKRVEILEQHRQMQARKETMLALCAAVAPVPFEAIGFTTNDHRWALYLSRPMQKGKEATRIDTLAETYANFALAWGIDFSEKWTALAMVVAVNTRIGGTIYAEIASEDQAQEHEDQADQPEHPN